jgi:DNA (cytosine-5)-methyltransferase 1
MNSLNYIDLYAGAGGLLEGFSSVVHVEMNKEAYNTLRSGLACHYKRSSIYYSYLKSEISRGTLRYKIPAHLIESVVNDEISSKTIDNIFRQTDSRLYQKKVDLIIGGPPCQAYLLAVRSRDPRGTDIIKYKFGYQSGTFSLCQRGSKSQSFPDDYFFEGGRSTAFKKSEIQYLR